jgi:DNA-binding MarR family transcriptional regulator
MTSHDTAASRTELRDALIDELTAYGPTRQMHFMRHWPTGRISLVHLNVIFILSGEGSAPMNRLAELLDVSQASATGIVDRMVQRGLVTRERDADDRRVIRVVLSDQGRELIAATAADRRVRLAQLLDTLADDDAAALLQGLRAMRNAREALMQHPSTSPDCPEGSR